jgi:hypothetical protein
LSKQQVQSQVGSNVSKPEVKLIQLANMLQSAHYNPDQHPMNVWLYPAELKNRADKHVTAKQSGQLALKAP